MPEEPPVGPDGAAGPVEPLDAADPGGPARRRHRSPGTPPELSGDPSPGPLPPGSTIVAISEAHLPQILRLERRIFPDPWSAHAFREELARESRGGYSRVLVESGAVRAYSVAWFVVDEGHLANIATDPRHRGRGLAGALLRDFLSEARRRGTANVWLEVRTGNDAAIRLYRTHGFRTVGIRKGYYRKEREDALVMVLPLEAETGRGEGPHDGEWGGVEGEG